MPTRSVDARQSQMSIAGTAGPQGHWFFLAQIIAPRLPAKAAPARPLPRSTQFHRRSHRRPADRPTCCWYKAACPPRHARAPTPGLRPCLRHNCAGNLRPHPRLRSRNSPQIPLRPRCAHATHRPPGRPRSPRRRAPPAWRPAPRCASAFVTCMPRASACCASSPPTPACAKTAPAAFREKIRVPSVSIVVAVEHFNH